MSLETMRPTPTWDATAYESTVDTLAAHREDLTYRIWGGDWCKDCRALLPDFGAALAAAEIPDDRIVEIDLDREKRGEGVEEYDIEYIPTIVVEDDAGREVTRFVEEEELPPAVWLAEEIDAELEG
ncbi:TlpA family protein disulfide reductase [Saliphagus infecundisoli]|uniref:TlpA family protein disulfide reductase n=1 Tax=Saliphagus infecundisoli TaxID=1849069 RepID=A0ABD5QFT3_9EURY|nr:thioredoxin family protein [Saliphagus infecundisoli]